MEREMWTIVEFVDDGSVEAVPSTWIQNDVCHWPPLPQNRLINAIKKCEPLQLSWPRHKIKVFRNDTFNDYFKARLKAKTAEETSDLQSENDNLLKTGKQKEKWVSSVSVSSDSDETVIGSLPLPPTIKKKKTITIAECPIQGASFNHEITNNNSSTQPCVIGNGETNNCQNYAGKNSNYKVLLEQNHLIRGLLTDVLHEIGEIKNMLKETGNKSQDKPTFFTKYSELGFPLNTKEALLRLEIILNDVADFEDAVQELAKIGGNNNYEFVKRVFNCLMTNDLALEYSWLGRKGKKEFHSLKTSNLMLCAAEKANVARNRRQTEVSIQTWLRRVSDRRATVSKKF
ncbi:uncharacterized protein LOC143179588 isoform X1 [Calliopsis andreniformis]|uniref:uncharacterized protein LOC143179588 isoform X1 n=1 Tax=Calliopsis andreniformis TaxID=337506 RepID=UPI003FCE7AB7